jgi:molecular chaperone DnaK
MAKEVILGIDLGTTNSVIAIWEGNEAKVIANSEGARTTPSVISFTKTGDVLVGVTAKRQAVTNPKGTVYSAKRFIGRTFAETKEEAKRMPYKVEQGKNGEALIEINNVLYTPQELSAKVLLKLKQAAEEYLGHPVTKAVITVPAYFRDSSRAATVDAGKIAGLEVLRVIAEPTAAALAYGFDKKKGSKIAVFDAGGGTFDISLLEIGDGVTEVIATNGDASLGGDNFDEALVDYLLHTFKAETGIDVSTDPIALQRLKESAEKAKIELSSTPSTDINLPFLTANDTGPKHLNLTLTRAKFEQLITPFVDKLFEPCKKAMADANLKVSDLDEVILVGGSTRVPLIQERVKKFFGKEPNKSVNPDEIVALGAAIQGAVLSGDVTDILLLDVTPLSLSLETVGGVATRLIERNTTIPTRKTQVFSTAADNQSAVTVNVFQGERPMAADNMKLASFTLSDIPPAPRGVPQIEIEYNIDANGIVSVSAKDLGTGKEQHITVTSSTKLSEDEIKKMVKEAEANAETDKQKKELAEAKNNLDSLVFNTEKLLQDQADKIEDDLKQETTDAIAAAKEKLGSLDLEELKATFETMQKQTHKVSEAMYKKQDEAAQTQEAKPSDDNVVDAQYEEAKPE